MLSVGTESFNEKTQVQPAELYLRLYLTLLQTPQTVPTPLGHKPMQSHKCNAADICTSELTFSVNLMNGCPNLRLGGAPLHAA